MIFQMDLSKCTYAQLVELKKAVDGEMAKRQPIGYRCCYCSKVYLFGDKRKDEAEEKLARHLMCVHKDPEEDAYGEAGDHPVFA